MPPEDHSGARPAGPVVLRIKLRYDDIDAMVQRFASNVGKSGLFLPTKSIQPIGTEVKFELRLANDTPVLVGLGRVKHVRPPDPANPRAAFGMGIELMRVSREGREVIIKMIERRRAMGLPDVAIPVPQDVEAARRSEFETQPRADSSGVVRAAMTPFASAPVSENVLSSASPASGPIAVAKQESNRGSAPLLTSPRAGGGSAGIAGEGSGRVPVPVLAPEKSRPRRPRAQELIARVESGPVEMVEMPDLDAQHVDLDHVLARARALAGGELDVELATLREAAAVPVEISIEAASAELARQLGGKPVGKRERSARWAPPPAIETPREVFEEPAKREAPAEPAAKEEFATKTRAETEAAPSATIAAVVEAAMEPVAAPEAAPEPAPVVPVHDRETQLASPPPVADEGYVPRGSEPVLDDAHQEHGYVREETPITDVREKLPPEDAYDDPAFMQNASTITAVEPEPAPPAPSGMLIDDDADVSSFERALDGNGDYAPDAPGEQTQIGASPVEPDPDGAQYPAPDQLAAQLDQQLAEAEQEAERELAEGLQAPAYYEPPHDPYSPSPQLPSDDDEDAEEISELDVLAEADEEDADLLTAHGEAELSGHHPQAPVAAYVPPATEYVAPADADDFAARLDLGPDSEPFERAYGHARAKRASSGGDFRDPPSSSYTFAENYPQAALTFTPHESGEDFDEPHGYIPDPAPALPSRGPDPRVLRHGRATTEDLEDALSALDGDFDDLSARPRARRPTPQSSSAPRPLPGLPIHRPADPAPAPRVSQPTPGRAHTVPRKPPTQQLPVQAVPPRKSPTQQVPVQPPPIPAAARMKPPTQPAPVIRRPPTDDGILIDFDDDE